MSIEVRIIGGHPTSKPTPPPAKKPEPKPEIKPEPITPTTIEEKTPRRKK